MEIFKNHKIEGFWLAHYLKDTQVEELKNMGEQAQVLMAQDFEIAISSTDNAIAGGVCVS